MITTNYSCRISERALRQLAGRPEVMCAQLDLLRIENQ